MKDIDKVLSIILLLCLISSCKEKVSNTIKRSEIIVKNASEYRSDSTKVEVKKYFYDSQIFLEERLIQGQTIDVNVSDSELYTEHFLKRINHRLKGGDLFIYKCSSCHGGYPFVKEEIDIDKYNSSQSLFNFVTTQNHGNWDESLLSEIDTDDLELIISYIKGPEIKPIE